MRKRRGAEGLLGLPFSDGVVNLKNLLCFNVFPGLKAGDFYY
jgi:hypothetical protein